jgi:transposase
LHNWHARGRTNVIGAITKSEFLTSVLINENINSEIFYQWLVDDLLKIAPKNSVIVLDNATFHKCLIIRKAIEKAEHKLLYMPSYSPHLNPIEKKWSLLKRIKQKEQNSVEDIFANFI